MFQVKADDDQTQLSCIANNPMITNHGKNVVDVGERLKEISFPSSLVFFTDDY